MLNSKKIWANAASQDLDRTRDFYLKLGYTCKSSNKKLVSVTFGESNFIINFFLNDILQNNTRCQITDLKNGNEIIFSLSAESKGHVNAWVELVKKAGGMITVEPYEIGQGYTFVFADPDGHKFNVLYWPGM